MVFTKSKYGKFFKAKLNRRFVKRLRSAALLINLSVCVEDLLQLGTLYHQQK